MPNDYGASHDFKKHGHGELRISRTIYFKHKHFEYIVAYAEQNKLNISEATDLFIQKGIAHEEREKYQQTLTEMK